MPTEKAIFDFITSSDENIRFALNLAAHVNDLQREMQIGFWKKYNQAIKDKFLEEKVSEKWKFNPFTERRSRKDWEKSYIAPKATDGPAKSRLEFAFGQNTPESGYRLMWGVCWTGSRKPSEEFDHPSLTNIQSILVANHISLLSGARWIRWGDYPLALQDADFLVRMNNEPEKVVGKVVEDIWKVFSELKPYMEEINAAVDGK